MALGRGGKSVCLLLSREGEGGWRTVSALLKAMASNFSMGVESALMPQVASARSSRACCLPSIDEGVQLGQRLDGQPLRDLQEGGHLDAREDHMLREGLAPHSPGVRPWVCLRGGVVRRWVCCSSVGHGAVHSADATARQVRAATLKIPLYESVV